MSRERHRRIQWIDRETRRLRAQHARLEGTLTAPTFTNIGERRDAYALRTTIAAQLDALTAERDTLTQQIAAERTPDATKWATLTGTDGTDRRSHPRTPPNRSTEEQ